MTVIRAGEQDPLVSNKTLKKHKKHCNRKIVINICPVLILVSLIIIL